MAQEGDQAIASEAESALQNPRPSAQEITVKKESSAGSSCAVQPSSKNHDENDEHSKSEKDGVDDESSDDDVGILEEFKEKVDAVIKGFCNPYDPSTEAAPKFPAYHPSFSKVEKYCGELLTDAAELLKKSDYQDSRLLELGKHAELHQTLRFPRQRIIGLVGDSGVGKSSLINSILDSPEIAPQGADGSACTCVITEYRQAWPHQNSPFMAEIVLFLPEQIKTMLTDHFKAYFRYHMESHEELDEEALDEMEIHLTTAFDSFKAIFADRPEFQNEDTIRDFFGRSGSSDEKKIVATLVSWVEQVLLKNGAENGHIYLTADTASELTSKMEPCIKTSSAVVDSEEDSLRPSLWPMVRVVRVGLQSLLLERGLIIADLPGLSDINKVRTKLTTRYITRCDFVIVVAPIARVQTDDMVHKRLLQYSRFFGPRKALLCTKIDDMPQSAKPRDLAASAAATDKYNKLLRAYEFAGSEKSNLTKLIKKAKGKAKKDATRQIHKLGILRKVYGALMHETLVVMRSQKVTRAMRKKYKALTSDLHTLNVICVSNHDYGTHKEGYDDEDIPLSLPTTGIPNLRSFLPKYPAAIKRDVLRQYFKGTVPELINSMEMWSMRSANHRRLELREVVEKPCKAAVGTVAIYVQEVKSHLEGSILGTIKISNERWIRHGMHCFEQWKAWKGATFGAWCRHDGAHKTKRRPFESWNDDLLEPVAKDVTKAWQSFDESLEDAKDKCFTSLIALLDSIREELSSMQGMAVVPMAPFMKSLAPKKIRLDNWLEDFSRKVKRASKIAKLNAITEDADDSYLLQALLPVYADCKKKKGKNALTAKQTLLGHAIETGVPYSKIWPGVKATMETEIDTRHATLLKNVQNVFDMVLADFDEMFVVEELPDPKRDAMARQIQDFVVKANQKLDGPVETEWAKAMNCSA